MTTVVERIDPIEVEEFRSTYADAGRPVIIRGLIDHWPARRRWTLEYLEQKFGDKLLSFSGKQWRLGDFVKKIRGGDIPAPYLNQVKLDEQFRELREDVGDLAYTRANALNSPLLPFSMRITRGISALFIGGAGSGFGKLHWDFSYLHVYISQVRGPKDFLIFAPKDSPHLYPNPVYPMDSLIKDINNFDTEEYPNIRNATPIRFTVQDGETVFIPAGWWHSTKMNELSISIAESALDRANWKQRYEGYIDAYRKGGVNELKLGVLSGYMKTMGMFVR